MSASKGFPADDDDTLGCIRSIFSCIGNTNLNENALNSERQKECNSRNNIISNERRYTAVLTSERLKARFKYFDLPSWQNEVIPPGIKGRSMASMYKSSVGESSLGLKGVTGTPATPHWHSPSPIRQFMVDHDMDVFRELDSRSEFGKLGHLYLGMLMGGQNMWVNLPIFGERWYFVLADSGTPGKFGALAVRKVLGGEVYWQLPNASSVGDTPFLHVYRVDEWMAIEVDFEAPLARVARHNGCDLVGAWARQVSKAEALLKFPARRCFFNLPKTALLTLSRHLDCECDAADDLLERCKKLIYHSPGT